MNIQNRLKKIEAVLKPDSKFCRCGTPYYKSFVVGGENILNEVCSDCGRDVEPKTIAEFVKEAHEYEVIEPTFESGEENL